MIGVEETAFQIVYPVVCDEKQDGSICLCIDFCLLNAVTKLFDYPMENETEFINEIGGANIITCLSVLKGYWEIHLEEQICDLTSVKTHRAQYR